MALRPATVCPVTTQTRESERAGVGGLLRRWRESRRLSQLELGLEAEVSTRHISFLETGRSAPSREMVLTLANVLEVPLREQNVLLLAAGYAPVHSESGLDDPRMAQVRAAVELILSRHEPHSAFAFDRYWDLVMVNRGYANFLEQALGYDPGLEPLRILGEPRLNVLRLVFDPAGVRRTIVNWEQVAKALLGQAHRSAIWTRDERLRQLIDELLSYPGVPARWREPDLEAAPAVLLPVELAFPDGRQARMFSTATTLSTPQDITAQELHIEAFYPADPETEALFGRVGDAPESVT